jgi:transposase
VYYPHVTQSREAPAEQEPEGVTLGVDLGIVNLATDSEGEQFTGAIIRIVRGRYHLRRQRVQKVGAKNAKRRLRQIHRSESRFQSAVNHCVSKKIVQKAAVSCKAIALEDCRESRREQRFDTNIATSGIPRRSSNCANLSAARRRRRVWLSTR